MIEPALRPEELPPVSYLNILWRVSFEVMLATAHLKPKERAPAALKLASEILRDEESSALLFPLRPGSEHTALSLERRKAVALFRAVLPTFNARVPKDI